MANMRIYCEDPTYKGILLDESHYITYAHHADFDLGTAEVYARELIKTGLAEPVAEKIVIEKPVHITAKEIGQVRTKSGRFMPKAKVK